MHSYLRKLYEKYKGKIRIINYHFPLTKIHKLALHAAKAAECSRFEGKYETYTQLLYDNQDILNQNLFMKLAKISGIKNLTAFKLCLESDSIQNRISNHIKLGKKFNIKGTPTLIINGKIIIGTIDFKELEKIIQNEINQYKEQINTI